MRGEAFVFINFRQALRFGHIGWGFQTDEDKYCYGSTDHLWKHHTFFDLKYAIAYATVAPEDNNDWWMESGSREEMLATMRHSNHIWYHAYKSLAVGHADPEAAVTVAKKIEYAGWHVWKDNCIHQTHAILTAYGAGRMLPDPEIPPTNRISRVWFAQFPGEPQELRPLK